MFRQHFLDEISLRFRTTSASQQFAIQYCDLHSNCDSPESFLLQKGLRLMTEIVVVEIVTE